MPHCRRVGWLGVRSAAAVKKMPGRLRRLQAAVFFAGGREAYAGLNPPERLMQTKAEACGIERNNFRQLHWCGKFRRKTCIVPRGMLMIGLPVFMPTVHGKRYCAFVIILFKILSNY